MTTGPGISGPGTTGPLLVTRELSVRYGGHRAVSDVDIEVGRGELVGLIGANGAGKTTTFDAICGFVKHAGTVEFAGADVTGLPPHRRARAGMARTWQGVELFGDLTIAQNCSVAARPTGIRALMSDLVGRGRSATLEPAVTEALAAVRLDDVADRLPGELPLGRQKLAGVARALAGSPKLVLLDEPAAGLDESESMTFGRALRSVIVDAGLSGLLIDHDTRLMFDVCDRIYVLDFGSVVAAGLPDEVRRDARVIEAYLGVKAQP